MKLINEALKRKGITLKKLPEEIKDQISSLKQSIEDYNKEAQAYEDQEDEDTAMEEKLDQWEDEIAAKDHEIASQIKNYQEPKPEPKPEPEPAPAPVPEPVPAKKEDNSVGWLIFGGVVLALTLGAVNLMKKK